MSTHLKRDRSPGTGKSRELAELVAEVVGYQGNLEFDTSKRDGTPRKLLDVGKVHGLGWRAEIELRGGLEETYAWYLQQLTSGQVRAV